VYSIPDRRFKPLTPGGSRPAVVRLDSVGLERFASDPPGAAGLTGSRRLSLRDPGLLGPPVGPSGGPLGGEEKGDRVSLTGQFLRFLSRQAGVLNAMVAGDGRLLESSLAVLRLSPDCRMHLSFDQKRRYFDLQVCPPVCPLCWSPLCVSSVGPPVCPPCLSPCPFYLSLLSPLGPL
jgi:hypothetical protein